MTQSGIVLIPLFMTLLLLPRAWSIPALYIAAVFSDASIVNGRPLLVPWFVTLLVIAREAWVIAIGGNRLRLDVLRRLTPLAVFVLACCLSLIVALAFFQNEVMVLPGSAGFDLRLAEPFHLVPENFNQLVYTGLIFVLVTMVANLAADLDRAGIARWVDLGMRWSCALATFAVVWHIASFTFGVWFPDQFFHSNIKAGAWAQGGFGDLTNRPSGSFAEPSELTYFYVMTLFYFFQKWRARGHTGDQIMLMISILVLLISTSTTAYMLMAVFACLAAADLAFASPARPKRARHGDAAFMLRGKHVVTVLVLLAAIAAGGWLLKRNQSIVEDVYQQQIVGKTQSRSYTERSTADNMAWRIFVDTYGVGIGLGSHRPNSGLLTVLGGSGLLGTLALAWLLMQNLARPDPITFARDGDEESKPLRWAVLGLLLGHLISGPNVHSILLWTSLALTVAFHLEQGQPARRAARLVPAHQGGVR